MRIPVRSPMARSIATAVTTTFLLLLTAMPAGAATQKYCGSFKPEKADGSRLYIYATKTSCKTASRVMKYWWTTPRRNIIDHGSGPGEYQTLRRYPGWRCTTGAGGGGCQRGQRHASYSYVKL